MPKKTSSAPRVPGSSSRSTTGQSVVVNVEMTVYEAIRRCAKERGWALQDRRGGAAEQSQGYDLYWTDRSVTRMRVQRLATNQMLNHFPGMVSLCSKAQLASNLAAMQRARPDAYSFAPSSWVLPDDYSGFLHACKEAARNSDDPAMFIVKPERGCQGKRIFLTRTADEDVIRDTFWTLSEVLVAQSYIQRPLIFDGLKFDLRLYALVTCVDPLRVYLYRDGLVRFCTEPYAEATALNKDHVFMHLTNHSLNKSNAAYEDSTDALDPTVGSKRRLVPFLDLLSKRGHDSDALWGRLEDIVAKTTIAAQPVLAYNHRLCLPKEKFGDRCFELLGVDVLVDERLNPWLLELNHSPSLHCNSPVDESVKVPLMRDALALVAGAVSRRAATKRAAERDEEKVGGARVGAGRLGEVLGNSGAAGLVELEDEDVPRYNPPRAERFRWLGRSEEEEAAWDAAQEDNDAQLGAGSSGRGSGAGFSRCLPPPKGMKDKAAEYKTLLEVAWQQHREIAARCDAGDSGSDFDDAISDSDASEIVMRDTRLSDLSDLSDESDSRGTSRKKLFGALGGNVRQDADEASVKAEFQDREIGGWDARVVKWAPLIFGIAIFLPPLMFMLFRRMRRVGKKHDAYDEADVWGTVAKWSLVIQLPVAMGIFTLWLRIEQIVQAVERGDNAIPVDEYLRDHVLGGEGAAHAEKAGRQHMNGKKSTATVDVAPGPSTQTLHSSAPSPSCLRAPLPGAS